MTRLPGWCYAGPDPDGYLAAAVRRPPPGVRRLVRRTRADGTTVVEVRRSAPGRRRFRVVTDAGTWYADTSWSRRSARQAAHAGRPAGSAAHEVLTSGEYRNPASCPTAACSSSVPRRRACRSPTSSTAPGARWSSRSVGTPGCRAATAAWTSSGGWRPPDGWPGPSTRCRTRCGATGTSLQLVGRKDPDAARPRPRPAVAAVARRAAAGPARRCRGDGARSAPTCADRVAEADRRCTASSTPSTPTSSGSGLAAEVWPGDPAAPGGASPTR